VRDHAAHVWSLVYLYGAEHYSRGEQFDSILENQKTHYRIHKSSPLVPILSQINPVHITPSYAVSNNLSPK
jgi:hypothetical protein